MMRSDHVVSAGLAALASLDLSQVKRKIMEPYPEGHGWTQEQADIAEKWYRRFLEVMLRRPEVPVVPNYAIDMFWHQHILDTKAYIDDCNAIFGEYIHHYPYYGMNGDSDERDESFDYTNAIYTDLFGEDCTTMPTFVLEGGAGCNGGGGNRCSKKVVAQSCNGKGSGTGCSRKVTAERQNEYSDAPIDQTLTRANNVERVGITSTVACSCNHNGSGTGCGQRCRREPIRSEAALGCGNNSYRDTDHHHGGIGYGMPTTIAGRSI